MELLEYTSIRMSTAMKMVFCLTLVVFVMSAQPLRSQSKADSSLRVGVYGGLQHNSFTGDYQELPGTQNCCPDFTGGSGTKPFFGAQISKGFGSMLRAELRLGLSNFGVSHVAEENIGNALVFDGTKYKVVDAISKHSLSTEIPAIEIEPRVLIYPSTLPLYIHAGLSAFLISDFRNSQSETLIQPEGTMFSDTKSNTRNVSNNTVTDINKFMLAPNLGLGYEIAIPSANLLMSPEISYVLPLGSFVKFAPPVQPNSNQQKYTLQAIRAGFSLSYIFQNEPKKVETTIPPPLKLFAKIIGREVTETGERDIATVHIKETISTQLYPLIPYIFFDSLSSDLPKSLKTITTNSNRQFDTTALFRFGNVDNRPTVTMDVYYQILNIVGKRLQRFENAVLTITGYNNDRGPERNNTTLSEQRARTVQRYLKERWNIPESRLIVQSGNLSPRAAKTTMRDAQDVEDGYQENRRVELSCTNPQVLQPLLIYDTLRQIRYPNIRFSMSVNPDSLVREWSMRATHPDLSDGSTELIREARPGKPPAFVPWNTPNSQQHVPRSQDPISIMFKVTDNMGQVTEAESKLPVVIETVAKRKKNKEGNIEISKYRLVGFDYESSDINTEIKVALQQFVSPDTRDADSVFIHGYTDRKGQDEHNQQLAQARANSIQAFLRQQSTVSTYFDPPVGMKESDAQFEHQNLPEERLYNRMVVVDVHRNAK